jgi:hypothetical protein
MDATGDRVVGEAALALYVSSQPTSSPLSPSLTVGIDRR